ncbi:OmpA family protein [Salinispirillum sp. LH 10-3-1]|uniref:OmpA family protein n=1 Tax=Salinispirillum sp. LH 10-3-1 TaxID=2952525 RepID=A0AB38YDR7_9GAMM
MVRHVTAEVREAEEAVALAEQPVGKNEDELSEFRISAADSLVEIATARATARQAEADRANITERRDAARLTARTLEADKATADARNARSAEAASSASSAQQAEQLRQRIQELEATATERGLVLTLGDVLFATGSAQLHGDSNRNLDKLVTFLNQYPERRVLIEGHTDNVGTAAFNKTLSQQRAEAVQTYLTDRDIASRRLSVSGVGFDRPVASNDNSTGRQQNRRVEVIIENQ